MRPIERLQGNLAISVPTLSQIAAEAAFDGRAEMEAVKHGYEENRRILIEGLPKAGLDKFLPVDGAFYLYADISRFSDDSLDFAKRMLEEARVAATPGIDFDPVNGRQFPALLLCRLGRRDARGGRADRQLAQARLNADDCFGGVTGSGRRRHRMRIGEVLRVFLRLGLTSFGGPIAHLGYFRDEFVVRRRWLDEKTYADLVALCQFLPGPASSQGRHRHRPVARRLSRARSRPGPASRCRRRLRWCCSPTASTRSATRSAAAGCTG